MKMSLPTQTSVKKEKKRSCVKQKRDMNKRGGGGENLRLTCTKQRFHFFSPPLPLAFISFPLGKKRR